MRRPKGYTADSFGTAAIMSAAEGLSGRTLAEFAICATSERNNGSAVTSTASNSGLAQSLQRLLRSLPGDAFERHSHGHLATARLLLGRVMLTCADIPSAEIPRGCRISLKPQRFPAGWPRF